MRKIIVLLCSLTALLVPTLASAQTLDRVFGLLNGATAYGYNSCSYVNGGLQTASCQANRAINVVNTLRQSEQNARYRQQERFNRRASQLQALQRACQAGDQESCDRSGGADGKQMEVARALMDACTAGDKRSCARASAMMDERSSARSEPRSTRYDDDRAPVRSASTQSCRPVIDPRTGYRVAGEFDCR